MYGIPRSDAWARRHRAAAIRRNLVKIAQAVALLTCFALCAWVY